MKPQRGTRITNKLLCILCLFVAWQSNVHAQTPKKDPFQALRQLLNFVVTQGKALQRERLHLQIAADCSTYLVQKLVDVGR
jgi:hypothetical protein